MSNANSDMIVQLHTKLRQVGLSLANFVLTRIFSILPPSARAQINRIIQVTEGPDFHQLKEVWQSTKEGVATVILAGFVANFLALAFPLTLLQIYDRIIPNEAIETLTVLLFIVVLALLLELALKLLRSYVSSWSDAKFEHALNCVLFKRAIRAQLSHIEAAGAGVQLERLNATQGLKEFFLGQTIGNIVDIPFVFIFLFLIAYIGGLVVLVPIGCLSLLIFLSIRQGKVLQKRLHERRQQDDKRLNFIIESLEKIHTIKSLGMEAQILRRYERLQLGNTINNYLITSENSKMMVGMLSVTQLNMILLVGFGAISVIGQNLTMGGLIACSILSGRCVNPVNQLVGLWTRLQNIQISENKIIEILEMPQEADLTRPNFGPVEGSITLEDISIVARNDASNIDTLSIKIAKGETIGLTGQTGKDNSMIFRLIQGIEKPDEGRVLIDGKPIEDFNIYSLREQIAYLPNKVKMFNGTILENLTMFDSANAETAMRLTKNLGVAQFIERLPKGYDTEVGKHTVEELPRGTLQIISIARSLIRQPRIILFDEANSELDAKADEVLKGILLKIQHQYTMILISQRPSLLKMSDRIFTLHAGGLEPYEQ